MSRLLFVMSLRKAADAFKREMAIAQNDAMVGYRLWLRDFGFDEIVRQVTTACVMYPRSLDACRDCLHDLSHSLHDMGKVRLNTDARDRLTNLVNLIGNEVLGNLEPHGFYEKSFNSLWSHYDDVTADAVVRRISHATFEVIVTEYRDEDGHRLLSDKSFGTLQESHWSH